MAQSLMKVSRDSISLPFLNVFHPVEHDEHAAKDTSTERDKNTVKPRAILLMGSILADF